MLDALLENISKEEFIGKPELIKELIDLNAAGDIRHILSDTLKIGPEDFNRCKITVLGCPEGGYTVFEYAMLNNK